jgi:hypothetical protein
VSDRLAALSTEAQNQLTRSEGKANAVFQGAAAVIAAYGIVVAGLLVVKHPSLPANVKVLGAGTGIATLGVLVLATLVIFPKLGGVDPVTGERHGWLRYAGKTGSQVIEIVDETDPDADAASQVGYLTGLAKCKHRLLQGACVLSVVAATLLVATFVAALRIR